MVTDPVRDPAGFRENVRSLNEAYGYDLLIPAADTSALPLLGSRHSLGTTVIAFPDEQAYLSVSDKSALMEVARRLGVRVPVQVELKGPRSDQASAHAFAAERDFDVVLKPARSAALAEGGVARFQVRVTRTEEDFRATLAAYPPEAYPMLIQERVSGPGLGVFMLTQAGEPIASFAHRRLREKPPTGGVSVYRESVAPREDVRGAAEAILRHYNWTGVAMVEFKEDARNGVPYLMEVNGRFWGSLQLAVDSGVDFPQLLARVTVGEDVAPVTSYRIGVRSRWLWGDFDHLLWLLRNGRDYRGAFPELPTPVGGVLRFLVPWRPGDRYEVLRGSDPRPFFRESAQWLRSAFRGR
jgi:predicted ATP-grasp superfamily ATP-dependent carboligase